MQFLLAMLVPMLWGSSYAAIGLFLTDISPHWLAVWRALPAGLILLLFTRRLPALSFARITQLGVMNIAIFFMLLFIAAYRLPGAIVGTLGATLPIQILLIQWIFSGHKPNGKTLVSAIFGLVGVMILLNPQTGIDLVGVACALVATLMVSISTIKMQSWHITDMAGTAAWQLIIGGTVLIPVVWAMDGAPSLPTLHQLPGLIWLVVLNTSLAYWLFVRAIRNVGASTFALLSLLNPVTAVVLGIVLVGEGLEASQWIGISIIITSLAIKQVSFKKRVFKKLLFWRTQRVMP